MLAVRSFELVLDGALGSRGDEMTEAYSDAREEHGLQTVKDADSGEIKRLMGNTYFSWMIMSSNGNVEKGMGGSVAITDKTGLLFYVGGTGWGGLFESYKDFHNRSVARVVKAGSPEVTATVTVLEDLANVPSDFFATNAPNASEPLRVAVVDEKALRANLLANNPASWPPLKDGPLEGALTTNVIVDRSGRVREVGIIVSDNPGLADAAREQISSLRFSPYLQDALPVQVVSRITMSFKTVRPAGVESFDTARNYFERGRLACFPAAGNGSPYVLRADGPDEKLLRLVMRVMEPIPALDTYVESDWRMKREIIDGVATIRVLAGYESPEGKLDKEQARGYWFGENGGLLKAHFRGLDIRRSSFEEFHSAQVARQIQVFYEDTLAMIIKVTDLSATGDFSSASFEIGKHKWQRAFTDEVR